VRHPNPGTYLRAGDEYHGEALNTLAGLQHDDTDADSALMGGHERGRDETGQLTHGRSQLLSQAPAAFLRVLFSIVHLDNYRVHLSELLVVSGLEPSRRDILDGGGHPPHIGPTIEHRGLSVAVELIGRLGANGGSSLHRPGGGLIHVVHVHVERRGPSRELVGDIA
jgi:hypothetical protein